MKYVITLLVGLVLGVAATAFFLGMPRAKSAPGRAVQAPSPGDQPSSVVVTINSSFFETLLGTLFRDLGPPSLRLGSLNSKENGPTIERVALQEGCTNTITLAQDDGSNVKTQVQFTGGKISVPLAFSGNYNLLGNCMQFKGWAQNSIQLRFDQASQTVYGQINVDDVNLVGVNPIANNFVTVFVRNAIDQKVNPLELIRAPQLQLAIPVKASNGAVKAQVKDVRAEVLDGSLKLHILYEFSGQRSG
jgi:hypothetical protein